MIFLLTEEVRLPSESLEMYRFFLERRKNLLAPG
jgi:hypothetical protein